MSKFGIHSFVWSAGSSRSELETALAKTRDSGFKLIEFSYLDPAQVDVPWLARSIKEHGLDVAISMGLPAEGDVSSAEPAVVKRGGEILAGAIALTRDLGGTKLAGILSSSHGKQVLPPTQDSWKTSVEAIAKAGDVARAAGVTLNLEIVNRFESNLLNTAAQGIAFIEDTGADNVFLHLDSFHMNIEEADYALAIHNAAGKIGYVHIGESHRGYLGTGNIDFAAIFDALVAIDYDDWITFESFSSEIVDEKLSIATGIWRNLWDDNVALAAHAHKFMDLGIATAKAKPKLAKDPQKPAP